MMQRRTFIQWAGIAALAAMGRWEGLFGTATGWRFDWREPAEGQSILYLSDRDCVPEEWTVMPVAVDGVEGARGEIRCQRRGGAVVVYDFTVWGFNVPHGLIHPDFNIFQTRIGVG